MRCQKKFTIIQTNKFHPQGVPELSRERHKALRAAKPAFDRAWDAWDADREFSFTDPYGNRVETSCSVR